MCDFNSSNFYRKIFVLNHFIHKRTVGDGLELVQLQKITLEPYKFV